jgi:type VI secretion system protein ImpC
MESECGVGGTRQRRTVRDDSEPMRLLVLGDFSGRPSAEPPPLATRPTHKVDVDTLNAVIQRISPRLLHPSAGEIAFHSIDDFHPDSLFRRLDVFEALRRQRTTPPTRRAGADDDLRRLLGKPAEPATTHAAPAGGIDALIRSIVAPHVVEDTTAATKSYLEAVDAATAAEMKNLLHESRFQTLESAWRGVQWLTSNLDLDGPLQLHLFDTTREELIADVVAAQGRLAETGLYKALVDRSRNVPGGHGWSVITALMEFNASDTDMGLLASLGSVAAYAGAPLLAGADGSLTGDEAPPANWSVLRRSTIAPYIGLTTPRVLLRLPYGKASDPIESFTFEEVEGAPVPDELLWGTGALAATLLLGRGFNQRGWEMEPGDEREIADLPAYTFMHDGERALQPCAERPLSESHIDRAIRSGLIPIASHRDRNAVTMVRVQSIADPPAPLAW